MKAIVDFTTEELVSELKSREGVQAEVVKEYEKTKTEPIEGPAIVLIVTD